MNRINESNQPIASMNRIDESNQRIEPHKRPPNDPKRPLKRPKTTTWGALGPSWDGLGGVLGRSWGLLGPLGTVLAAILGPSKRKIEIKMAQGQSVDFFGVDFGVQNDAQNDPKTIPKRVKNQDEKCIGFLSLLEPSWTDLGSILDPSWGHKSGFVVGFTTIS